jgi:nickel/cobalt transporter (NicO) family protein
MPVIFFFSFLALVFYAGDASASDGNIWSDTVMYIHTQQQSFLRELSGAIRAIQDGGMKAFWGLVSISFFYGVFHAAGPGHGKAIIGTYLITHESKLRRGILLSFAAAFVQGLSAILLVEGMIGLVGWTKRDTQGAVSVLENVSFVMISLIGLMLMYRAGKAFWNLRTAKVHDHHHGHDHHHNHHDHEHDAHSSFDDCAVCGHSHAINPDVITKDTSIKDMIFIVVSIGIRPCSGSVLILIFAEVIGLRWAGISSVFAISFGTALTVSALGILAVYFRKIAISFSENSQGNAIEHIGLGLTFLGGLVIVLLGGSLLLQSVTTTHPLF